jgi:hypothetical protein
MWSMARDQSSRQPDLCRRTEGKERRMRISILGNAGGGKSRLARQISQKLNIPHIEIDKLLWLKGWVAVSEEAFQSVHQQAIDNDQWIMDGLGKLGTISSRIERSTHVVLIDMPLWQHFALAAERQIAWSSGALGDKPGGLDQMPPTRGLFETMWVVDQEWMPSIRHLVDAAEAIGTQAIRIRNLAELEAFHFLPSES